MTPFFQKIKIILVIFFWREFKLSTTFFSIWIRIFSARFSQTPYKRASEDLCSKQWVKTNLGVASSFHTPQLSSGVSEVTLWGKVALEMSSIWRFSHIAVRFFLLLSFKKYFRKSISILIWISIIYKRSL